MGSPKIKEEAPGIVLIEWVDSKSGSNQWEYREGLESLLPVTCSTVGFLIEETDEYVTLAHSLSRDQVCGLVTIPAGSVTRIHRLAKPSK